MTTICYKATVIKFTDHEVTVEFIGCNTVQTLPIYIEINGHKLPTVIRKYPLKNSFQFNKLLRHKQYSMMDQFRMQSEIKCIFNQLAEFCLYPCGHYIWMCQCKICKRNEIPKILNTKCQISICNTIITGLHAV